MAKIERFEDLKIWQEAVEIEVEIIYLFQKEKKLEREFEIKNQLTAAGLSISNNIAEGFEYNNNPDFKRFLRFAKGSTGECRNIFYVIKKSKLADEKNCDEMILRLESLSRQIKSLIDYLNNRNKDDKK